MISSTSITSMNGTMSISTDAVATPAAGIHCGMGWLPFEVAAWIAPRLRRAMPGRSSIEGLQPVGDAVDVVRKEE
jgi:hypothetical protein